MKALAARAVSIAPATPRFIQATKSNNRGTASAACNTLKTLKVVTRRNPKSTDEKFEANKPSGNASMPRSTKLTGTPATITGSSRQETNKSTNKPPRNVPNSENITEFAVKAEIDSRRDPVK